MSRFSERSRGITLQVRDMSDLEAEARAFRQRTNPACYEAKVQWGPWATVTKNGRLYAICSEGVGYEVSDAEPFEAEFTGRYSTPDEPNRHLFDVMSFATVELTPAELIGYPVTKEVDLADFIRTFGDRLESNFWSWYDELK